MHEFTELLRVEHLKKYFSVKGKMSASKRTLKAVDDVSFSLGEGETLGLVGESGCGKSTLGRTILRLHSITDGSIFFRGKHIENLREPEMRALRRDMQIIFQDPYASLNPRTSIGNALKSPLDVFNIGAPNDRPDMVADMLARVGLTTEYYDKLPHEMSGGQRQRVVIARAMISSPSFVVCDEPVSALDVSVRAQVLNLMKDMKDEFHSAYLFISHDLSTVRYLCDRIAVMYLGHIIELAPADELFRNPVHPYTKALLSAIPQPDVDKKRNRILLTGDVPSPIAPPSGCPFRTRCAMCDAACEDMMPVLNPVDGGSHFVACMKA